MDERGREQILGEQLLSQLQAIHELVQDIPEMKTMLGEHGETLKRIEGRLIILEDVVTSHSTDIARLKAQR